MSGQEDRLKAVEPETANCGQQQRHDTLTKSERVCSRNTVEQLFGGGQSRAMSAFPIRMVYMMTDRQEGEPAAQMLVSVPKRCFKRAVKRNRVKRQVREAYRHLKHGVIEAMTARQHDKKVVMAFICIDSNLHPTDRIARKMQNLISRLEERINGKEQAHERSEQGNGLLKDFLKGCNPCREGCKGAVRPCHEGAGVASGAAHLVLSTFHNALHPTLMPFHTHLLRIWPAGSPEARPHKRIAADPLAHLAL